jgi:hypothetical protein
MSPFSLTDDELNELTNIAVAIPVDHRDAFLQAVAIELARYPSEAIGVGLISRIARQLQRQFLTPSLGSVPHSRAY